MTFTNEAKLLPKSIQEVLNLIGEKAKPKQILLFGSRARLLARENSDFDIAVEGKRCTDLEWSRLLVEIEDSPHTLYAIDIVEMEKLGPDYIKQIREEGKVLAYE